MEHDRLSPIGSLVETIGNSLTPRATTTHGSTVRPTDTATSRPTQNTNTGTLKPASVTGSETRPNSRALTPSPNSHPPANSTSAPPERLMHLRNVSALVSRLLVHYWTADDHPAIRQAQIEDWIEDLVDFKFEDIEAACGEWRRTQIHRPTPAHILALIRQRQPSQPETHHHVTKAEIQKKAEHRQKMAPLWGLVRRSLAGEPVAELLTERKRMYPDD
jgi:hypothetical protein